MILIALFKKWFLSQKFFANVEVNSMAKCPSKSDLLRNINSKAYRARNITIYKREIDNIKIK